jgi:hypothetical protein
VTAARPVALFVLGMARSGTSALTRVLSLCGVALPGAMIGGFVGNPRGYWEPREVFHIDDLFLRSHGSAGYDPSLRLQEEGAIEADERAAWIAKIRAYLTRLPTTPVIVIKHPPLVALSEIWFEATRLAGFDIAAVIAVRHPQEVIASSASLGRLQTGSSQELPGALWLKYNLLSERNTRGVPRVFVEYPNLLDNWRLEVKRISASLAIDLSTRDDVEIEKFVQRDQRHQQHSGPVTELFGTDWFSAAYEVLRAAARDEPWDESVLDRVFEAYRSSERSFRIALEEFQRLNKSNRAIRPAMVKLGMEVLAIAHRRKGTWA